MLFIILFTTIRVSISSFSGPFKSKLAAEFTVVKSISDVISRKSLLNHDNRSVTLIYRQSHFAANFRHNQLAYNKPVWRFDNA